MGIVVKSFELDNAKLDIVLDECPDSPREWDNLTTMVCFHKRYRLGDMHDYRCEDYENWEELREAIVKNEDPLVILPLYMYDHSGITISTAPFSCPWDSGQIGFVFVPKVQARENFMVKRISKKIRERCEEVMIAEVKEYDQYLRGDIYGFVLYKREHCDKCHRDEDVLLDSCYGFYGYDITKNGILDHISPEVKAQVMTQL